MIDTFLPKRKPGEAPFEATLYENTGIQFIDLKIDLNLGCADDREAKISEYLQYGKYQPVNLRCTVPYESDSQFQMIPFLHKFNLSDRNRMLNLSKEASGPTEIFEKPENCMTVDAADSLEMFEGQWFPLPIFTGRAGSAGFESGPLFWSRGYLKKIGEGEYHLVAAFDTQTSDSSENLDENQFKCKPSPADAASGNPFRLCDNYYLLTEILLNIPELSDWINGLYDDYAERKDLTEREIAKGKAGLVAVAHYFNLIAILAEPRVCAMPVISLKAYNRDLDKGKGIGVDLVLDIGNSRTCGVLIEKSRNKTTEPYMLNMRNLTDPTLVYEDAFPSDVEFSLPSFDDNCAPWRCASGGSEKCFRWPSLARVGFEAKSLSASKEGNEGYTGISSPKRYLWDDAQNPEGWEMNCRTKSGSKTALVPILQDYINESGEALFMLPKDDQQAFSTKYSRRSAMTFMLLEIFSQAFCHINSPYQRAKCFNSGAIRYLESIVLTVPPAMPKQEIAILKKCAASALGILWKAQKWDLSDASLSITDKQCWEHQSAHMRKRDRESGKVPATFEIFRDQSVPTGCMLPPAVMVKWDEALCGQIVYLYNEVNFNFKNNPAACFRALARNPNADKLTLATVDIGGGTTDLVINEFEISKSGGESINPKQIFRDGFKLAGDDILLDIIRQYVITSIAAYIKKANPSLSDDRINSVIERIAGSSVPSMTEVHKRHQLALQLFEPLGVKIFNSAEDYGTERFESLNGKKFGDILRSGNFRTTEHKNSFAGVLSDTVDAYASAPVAELIGNPNFSILDVTLAISDKNLYEQVASGSGAFSICARVIPFIAEIINAYGCDIVLLTGRPSKLPGLHSCFRNQLGLPPERVISLGNYPIGNWYPGERGRRIQDPKTTVSVGAMLACRNYNGQLMDFPLKTAACDIKSCIRYIGKMGTDSKILKKNVYYAEMDFDDEKYRLSDGKTENRFVVHQSVMLGFRQLGAERWPASPLYFLKLGEKISRLLNSTLDSCLEIELERTALTDEDTELRNRRQRYKVDDVCIKSVKAINLTADTVADYESYEDILSDLTGENGVRRGEDPQVQLKFCTACADNGSKEYWLDSGVII